MEITKVNRESLVETPAGNFKVAVAPSADVDAVLNMTLDTANDVFDVREINIGNEEFTMALGRTNAAS